MRVYARGSYYWFEFEHGGRRYRKSSGLANKRKAELMAGRYRDAVVTGRAGLTDNGQDIPSLRQFRTRFLAWSRSEHPDKPASFAFDQTCYDRLLDYPKLADTPLHLIDERLIDEYKVWRMATRSPLGKAIGRTTVNRYLAILRKTLRYARDTLKLTKLVPKVVLFKKSDSCERRREFIFSEADYRRWIEGAPEPLRSASILARACGICRGELVALQKSDVRLHDAADEDGLWGELSIRRGLKRDARRRTLPITSPMREVLLCLMAQSKSELVFTAEDHKAPLDGRLLSEQARSLKRQLGLEKDAGLHTLRHSFLTEKGYLVDVFTLMKIAGHTNVATTLRYVHPSADAIRRAFRVSESTQNPHSEAGSKTANAGK